jgi:hypothetical protein
MNLAMIERIDGEEYIFSYEENGKELWLPTSGMEIKEDKCSVCGYSGVALDKHHIDGRKNSDITVFLCSNCHRELHSAEGYQ